MARPPSIAAPTVPLVLALLVQPGPVARAADPPDREGAAEIRGAKDLRAAIEAHRKGDFAVRVLGEDGAPLGDADVRIELSRHAFLFGANIYAFGSFEDPAGEEVYRERFAEIFNAATLPFYWRSYEPERDDPRYASTDAILRWCIPRGIARKGHPLVWTHPAGIPKWLDEKDAAGTRERILGRVREVAGRYRGRIARWEVVNEAAHTRAFAGFGDPIAQIVATYRAARDADPKAELILNEYDVLSGRLDLRAFAERAIAAGAAIDGIGVQAHEPLVPAFEPGEMVRILDRLAALKKPIHLTELAFTSDGRPVKRRGSDGIWRDSEDRWTEEFQADYVETFYRTAFAHPAVVSITWWDLADGRSWQEGGGLLRRDLSTKPAYERLRRLIREEWTTRARARTDAGGIARLRGFYGTYRIRTAGGLEATIELAKGAAGPATARLAPAGL
ncbi:MAG: endo-1,4-beta-xylanase [Planctomycetes bacterium]|nr:endo-1,4-beta-xylanase [Planctomycetota bacterium]